jgi:hypothetical protein
MTTHKTAADSTEIICTYKTARGTEFDTYDEARLAHVIETTEGRYLESYRLKAIVAAICETFDISVKQKKDETL